MSNEAIPAVGVVARENDRVRISYEADVRQALISLGSRDLKISFEVVGRESGVRG